MKTYQKVILALVVCGLGIGVFQWLRKENAPVVKEKEPIPVEAVAAKSGSILRKVTTAGTLVAIQWVDLHPEVEGKIAKIYFKEGEDVKAGEPLYKIEDAVYAAKVKEAEARLALAKAEYDRSSKLLEKKFVSISDRDKKYAEFLQAEANLEEAKIRLEKTTIKAPFEGVAGLSEVSVGALVAPSTLLVNIVDLDPILIDFNVPESYLPSIQVGNTVDVTVEDFDIQVLDAKIKAISPEIDENTRTVKVRAEMPNKERFYRPGEYARVLLEAGKVESAVLVPETAIEREGEEEYVMVVVDKVAIRTTVSTGLRDGNFAEITHGVKPGDLVISAGQFKVRDGDEVNVVDEKEKESQKE
jgi:membrane fusion protein (multidrug efflux system)